MSGSIAGFPTNIKVVIGDSWEDANVPFSEDDVIILQKIGATNSWSEDGTTTPNILTNRLQITPTSIYNYQTLFAPFTKSFTAYMDVNIVSTGGTSFVKAVDWSGTTGGGVNQYTTPTWTNFTPTNYNFLSMWSYPVSPGVTAVNLVTHDVNYFPYNGTYNDGMFKVFEEYILSPILPEQDMAQQVDFLLSGYHDNNGNALAGGKVYFYEPGTTNLQTIWNDADEAVIATNPVVLDAYGRKEVFAKGLYDIAIVEANGSPASPLETISEVYYKVDVASSALTIASVSSTPYAASSTGKLLLVNSAGEDIIVNLLSAATHGGEVIEIVKTSASNTATVTPDGSETINGDATFVLTDNYGFVKIRSDGTNWVVLSTNQGVLAFTGNLNVTGNITASGNITATGNLSAASISTLTTPLAANKGGTGQNVYVVGDLLYASSTSALSRLAKGANDTILGMATGSITWRTLSAAGIAASGVNGDITQLTACTRVDRDISSGDTSIFRIFGSVEDTGLGALNVTPIISFQDIADLHGIRVLPNSISPRTLTNWTALKFVNDLGNGTITNTYAMEFESEYFEAAAPVATTTNYIFVTLGGTAYKIKAESVS